MTTELIAICGLFGFANVAIWIWWIHSTISSNDKYHREIEESDREFNFGAFHLLAESQDDYARRVNAVMDRLGMTTAEGDGS